MVLKTWPRFTQRIPLDPEISGVHKFENAKTRTDAPHVRFVLGPAQAAGRETGALPVTVIAMMKGRYLFLCNTALPVDQCGVTLFWHAP